MATITSVRTGDWFNPSTWNSNSIPASIDDVILNHPVRVNSNIIVGSIRNLNTGGGELIISTNLTITCTGTGILGNKVLLISPKTINSPLIQNVGGVVLTSSDPDAQAFLNAAGITDATISLAITTLVTDLKGYGVWTKLKAIYPFVGGTATTHKFNLKDPRDLDAAFRLSFVGGWTHSVAGILGNGVNSFANTFYIPTIQSDSQNNSIAIYVRNNINTGQPYDISASNDAGANTSPYSLISRYTTNQAFFANGSYNQVGSNSDSRGFWNGFIDATNQRIFRNGLSFLSTSIPVATLTSFSLYIGANNGGGAATLFSNKEFAFASMGGTKLTTTEAANYYTAVQAFQTTLSRQV